MGAPVLQLADLVALAHVRQLSSFLGAAHHAPAVVVGLDDGAFAADEIRDLRGTSELGTLPAVLIGVGAFDHPHADLVDVIAADETEAQRIAVHVEGRPIAAASLALLLRHGAERSIGAGLVAESATYSLLQSGAEFRSWRGARPAAPIAPNEQPAVLFERDGNEISIVLNRPRRHNAVDLELSTQLVDALTAALADPDARVTLRGAGPSFCSGGDLDEFGSFPDPALAHCVRLTRSAGQLIAQLADRIEVHTHGATLGAGIELGAFAERVVVIGDASIGLPEIGLGLVPGAGGTVSLPRRIGRHRTALLALTGDRIDGATALQWGLVDDLLPAH